MIRLMLLGIMLIPTLLFAETEPQYIDADVVEESYDYSLFVIPDPTPVFVFHGNDGEIMRFEPNGEVYWKNRLVTTDQELVQALVDAINGIC